MVNLFGCSGKKLAAFSSGRTEPSETGISLDGSFETWVNVILLSLWSSALRS